MAERELRLTGAAGEYMESATVVEWLRQPGDAVREGEGLVLVETAKATTEVPAPCDGVLARVVAAAGAEVKIDGVLAILEAPSPALPLSLRSGGGSPVARGSTVPQSTTAPPPPERSERGRAGEGAPASPIARRLAREHGIDLATLTGSGPGGRVGERDVLAAIEARRSATPPARTDIYRRAMAKRISAAAAIPQFSVTLSVDGGGIERLLAALKSGDGAAVTANDVVMKAVALALREVPRFNARWIDGAAVAGDAVNLGMAVATAHGLAVPVIAGCDRLSLAEIASASFRLRRRAIARKLAPADVARPSFTVSNLGLLGAEEFVALINPPEVGILAVGAFKPQAVVRDGAVAVRAVARLTVTGDHRAVDGADAAKLLVAIRTLIEDAPAQFGGLGA